MTHPLRNSIPHDASEFERNAYNAAFYELGLRWHWNGETYDQLQKVAPLATDRLRHYLTRQHPHLLRAYDADFLIAAIESKKAVCLETLKTSGSPCHFNWAESLGAELGA